ncbi:MAG: hypothetical protein AAGB00_10860 [Planctomycetota bacterium]
MPPTPDAIDLAATLLVAMLFFGLPLLGYTFLVLDIRAYYRRARRAVMIVRRYVFALPEWVARDAPPCLQTLGLTLPCTRYEVLAAYRERVKHVHPDAGGSRRQFAKLQRHFEEAMSLANPDRP